MKKLNITKEQFEKSRYFKNKYGKLEYVSESGKVFKTDKGKVLMFKESYDRGVSRKTLKELKSAIGTLDTMLKQDEDNGTIMMQKEFVRLLHVVEDKIQKALELQSKMKVRNSYPDEDEDLFEESTKKFGRKFNESDELASILANLIRQASPESQERIMRMLERDADGTDDGKSAGERVRDSYRDDL